MKTWTVRLGLSLMIFVGFWSNPLPAQVLVVPTVPYEPAHQAYMPPTLRPEQPSPSPYHFRQMLNKHGMACQTNPFYPVCGNLHYELDFIFGSCRSFFGESCPPNAPMFLEALRPVVPDAPFFLTRWRES